MILGARSTASASEAPRSSDLSFAEAASANQSNVAPTVRTAGHFLSCSPRGIPLALNYLNPNLSTLNHLLFFIPFVLPVSPVVFAMLSRLAALGVSVGVIVDVSAGVSADVSVDVNAVVSVDVNAVVSVDVNAVVSVDVNAVVSAGVSAVVSADVSAVVSAGVQRRPKVKAGMSMDNAHKLNGCNGGGKHNRFEMMI